MKTMSSYKKGILLRTFFKSVFSLSPLKAGQEEGAADHNAKVVPGFSLWLGLDQSLAACRVRSRLMQPRSSQRAFVLP